MNNIVEINTGTSEVLKRSTKQDVEAVEKYLQNVLSTYYETARDQKITDYLENTILANTEIEQWDLHDPDTTDAYVITAIHNNTTNSNVPETNEFYLNGVTPYVWLIVTIRDDVYPSGNRIQFAYRLLHPDYVLAYSASNNHATARQIDMYTRSYTELGGWLPWVPSPLGCEVLTPKVSVLSASLLVSKPLVDFLAFSPNYFETVTVSGNYIVVASADHTDPVLGNNGRVFVLDKATGNQVTEVVNPGNDIDPGNDEFGAVLGMTSTTLAIGAPDANNSTNGGAVYIFDVPTFTLRRTILNPATGVIPADHYSRFVDNSSFQLPIDGNKILLSDYRRMDSGFNGVDEGRVYVYDHVTGDLLLTILEPTESFDAYPGVARPSRYFGRYTAMRNNRILLANGSFGLWCFDATTGSMLWYQTEDPTFDYNDVTISDSYAVVGDRFADKVRVYDLNTGTLLRTISNTEHDPTSGFDSFGGDELVAVGDYLITGSSGERTTDGIYDRSGETYIVDLHTGDIIQVIENPNVYDTPDRDYFGEIIAADDSTLAVVSLDEDSAVGTRTGAVYIYNLQS